MGSTNPRSQTSQIVAVNWADRWEVYRRLQDLQIPCQCHIHEPLQVEFHSVTDAIQLWSIVKQVTASNTELVSWLDRCWHLESNAQEL